MLTEVRVDESAQPHSKEAQSDAEKNTDPGLAEAVRSWVHRLLDRNDTNVHLVRMAPCAVVPEQTLKTITGRLVERSLSIPLASTERFPGCQGWGRRCNQWTPRDGAVGSP